MTSNYSSCNSDPGVSNGKAGYPQFYQEVRSISVAPSVNVRSTRTTSLTYLSLCSVLSSRDNGNGGPSTFCGDHDYPSLETVKDSQEYERCQRRHDVRCVVSACWESGLMLCRVATHRLAPTTALVCLVPGTVGMRPQRDTSAFSSP